MAKKSSNWFAHGSKDEYRSDGRQLGSYIWPSLTIQLSMEVKTKHFSIKLFYIRDVLKDGAVCLKYCKTENQCANIFTKALPRTRFEFLREKLGVCTYWCKEECWAYASIAVEFLKIYKLGFDQVFKSFYFDFMMFTSCYC